MLSVAYYFHRKDAENAEELFLSFAAERPANEKSLTTSRCELNSVRISVNVEKSINTI